MDEKQTPPKPVHQPGTRKGEDNIKEQGKEPGREEGDTTDLGNEPSGKEGNPAESYRKSRDSTKINPDAQGPIDPESPDMPPA